MQAHRCQRYSPGCELEPGSAGMHYNFLARNALAIVVLSHIYYTIGSAAGGRLPPQMRLACCFSAVFTASGPFGGLEKIVRPPA